jgi:hypothetical protein
VACATGAVVAQRHRHFSEATRRRISRRFLVPPEIAKPLGRKFAISNRMLDVFMAEIVLRRTSIHTLIGQLEPSRMPQHVGMDPEWHLGGRPKPRHHSAERNCGHRSAAFAHEDISSGLLFALATAQGAKFDAGQWVDGSRLRCNQGQIGLDQPEMNRQAAGRPPDVALYLI